MNNRAVLQNVYLFHSLNPEQMDRIGSLAVTQTFGSGEDIFYQGDKATAIYLVKYGSVHIHQRTRSGETVEIAIVGSGSHFGEMGFLDHQDRSATATTLERSELIVVDYQKLREAMVENPLLSLGVYKELAHFLCARLRMTTVDLSFSREKNLKHF